MKPFASHFHKNKMYHVCRNNDGFLELWRGKRDIDKKTKKGAEHDRIITTCREPEELSAYLNPPSKKKRKRYNPYRDPNQTRIE